MNIKIEMKVEFFQDGGLIVSDGHGILIEIAPFDVIEKMFTDVPNAEWTCLDDAEHFANKILERVKEERGTKS